MFFLNSCVYSWPLPKCSICTIFHFQSTLRLIPATPSSQNIIVEPSQKPPIQRPNERQTRHRQLPRHTTPSILLSIDRRKKKTTDQRDGKQAFPIEQRTNKNDIYRNAGGEKETECRRRRSRELPHDQADDVERAGLMTFFADSCEKPAGALFLSLYATRSGAGGAEAARREKQLMRELNIERSDCVFRCAYGNKVLRARLCVSYKQLLHCFERRICVCVELGGEIFCKVRRRSIKAGFDGCGKCWSNEK